MIEYKQKFWFWIKNRKRDSFLFGKSAFKEKTKKLFIEWKGKFFKHNIVPICAIS